MRERLAQLLDLLDEGVPAHVQHCVRAVAAKYGGDTSKAFAICVAQGQRRGTLKKGSLASTKRGKKSDRSKSRDPEHDAKMGEYEQLLAKARGESVRAEMHAILEAASKDS